MTAVIGVMLGIVVTLLSRYLVDVAFRLAIRIVKFFKP